MMRLLTVLAALLLAPPAVAEEAAGFAARFAAGNPLTMQVLKDEFPREFDLLNIRLRAIETAGQAEPVAAAAAFNAVTEIRRRYVQRVRFAPGPALALLLVGAADFHEAVFKREGAGLCGAFAQNGSGALFQVGKAADYAAEIDRQSALFLKTAAAGVEAPEAYGDMRPSDLAALMAVMAKAGVPVTYAKAIATGRPDDTNLCPALATMFRAASAFDTPEGLRVRADLAVNLVGY